MELNREMTNEEAIKWLAAIEEKYIHGGDESFDNQRRTALHLAKNALSLIKELTEENERVRGCVKSKEEVEAIMRATYEPLVKEILKEVTANGDKKD